MIPGAHSSSLFNDSGAPISSLDAKSLKLKKQSQRLAPQQLALRQQNQSGFLGSNLINFKESSDSNSDSDSNTNSQIDLQTPLRNSTYVMKRTGVNTRSNVMPNPNINDLENDANNTNVVHTVNDANNANSQYPHGMSEASSIIASSTGAAYLPEDDSYSRAATAYNKDVADPVKLPVYLPPERERNIQGGPTMRKLNHIIDMLDAQKNSQTGRVTEDVVLYTFLGIAVIFVVDTFAQV
jgi:hypothetical protein